MTRKRPQTTDHETMFSKMLKSDLPKEELSVNRLRSEVFSITGGVDTIKTVLIIASYGILKNPDIYKCLKK